MNINLDPTSGFPNLYHTMNQKMGGDNPTILIILSVIIIMYYFVFSNMSLIDTTVQMESSGISFIEVIMWALFVFLILINGLQYFFEIDVQASIRNIFSPIPEVDITIDTNETDKPTVPEIMLEKQVFHVPDNIYTYEESRAVCKAYGGRLAKYDEIEEAHQNGAEWCGYGWSDDQLALYPTQKKTYDNLQKIKGHEHDCGRPGINGGFIKNPRVRFGANCYGYKPEITPEERELMEDTSPYPITKKDKQFEKMVDTFKRKLPDILVAPFNNQRWSVI